MKAYALPRSLIILPLASCLAAATPLWATVDTLEDIAADGTVIGSRVIDGVTVTISTSNGTLMTARTYNDPDPFAFGGLSNMTNVPLNSGNVSGDRFISTVNQADESALFHAVQPITFEFSLAIHSFGLTTVDLLENDVPSTHSMTLDAFDASDAVVDTHTRTGPQGPSGLDLDWLVDSGQRNITKAVLSGVYAPLGAGYGIDDIVLVVPEPATLSLLALGGLVVIRRRRRLDRTADAVGRAPSSVHASVGHGEP